jgi:hypothetical protein
MAHNIRMLVPVMIETVAGGQRNDGRAQADKAGRLVAAPDDIPAPADAFDIPVDDPGLAFAAYRAACGV